MAVIIYKKCAMNSIWKYNEHVIYIREMHHDSNCKNCRNYEWNECEFILKRLWGRDAA